MSWPEAGSLRPAEADGTFFFSDHDVRVDAPIHYRARRSLERNFGQANAGDVRVLTRAGGRYQIEGRELVAEQVAPPAFAAGDRFVFLVDWLPEVDAYMLARFSGMFRLEGGQTVVPDGRLALTERQGAFWQRDNFVSALRRIRCSADSAAKERGSTTWQHSARPRK